MNPVELLNLLADLIRRGADHVAAFVLGFLVFFSIWFVYLRGRARRMIAMLRKERDQALERTKELENEKTKLVVKHSEIRQSARSRQSEIDRLRHTQQDLTDQCEQLKESCKELADSRELLQDQLNTETQRIQRAENYSKNLFAQLADANERLQELANRGGKIWEKPRGNGVCNFRPLEVRGAPIVSVANLKGGVGKTTITANLGAALWSKGHRVLLVDLDYQGSLTSLCLPDAQIDVIRQGKRFVQNLFTAAKTDADLLLGCVNRIGSAEGYLVAADDNLKTVEMQALANWLVVANELDVRYRLRSVLHAEEIQSLYDIILLDCPPRLFTACVNAFTASDYLLIPVLPNVTSAEAVPRLLKTVRNLKASICPELDILGVVANGAKKYGQDLIKSQKEIWKELPAKCMDMWREPVYHFSTIVPYNNAAFDEAAKHHSFAAFSDQLQGVFLSLVNELEERMPIHEGRRSSVVH